MTTQASTSGGSARFDGGNEIPETNKRYHIKKPPNTPKEKAIVDAALRKPNGTNPELADLAYELAEGEIDKPDPSWVSRVRNEFLEEVVEETPPPQPSDESEEMSERIDRLEEEIDALIDAVTTMHETLDRIERREREEAIDELESQLEELRGRA